MKGKELKSRLTLGVELHDGNIESEPSTVQSLTLPGVVGVQLEFLAAGHRSSARVSCLPNISRDSTPVLGQRSSGSENSMSDELKSESEAVMVIGEVDDTACHLQRKKLGRLPSARICFSCRQALDVAGYLFGDTSMYGTQPPTTVPVGQRRSKPTADPITNRQQSILDEVVDSMREHATGGRRIVKIPMT